MKNILEMCSSLCVVLSLVFVSTAQPHDVPVESPSMSQTPVTKKAGKCAAAKAKATGKYLRCSLRATSQALERGKESDTGRCEPSFRARFRKAEKRGGDDCPTIGDQEVVRTAAEIFVKELTQDLSSRKEPRSCTSATPSSLDEFELHYTTINRGAAGSTHELTFQPGSKVLWTTAQNWDAVAQITTDGDVAYHPMEPGSGPHGIIFDANGRLFLTLEFKGTVVELSPEGVVVAEHDVRLHCETCAAPVNVHPHGLDVGPDGMTLWYTGKSTGTIGKIEPDGTVHTYGIPTVASTPIYIKAGADGNMWFTELTGNKVGRVTSDGEVAEYAIPTANSRPINIARDPNGDALWFTEEAGNKVGRIDMQGKIVEFPVPKSQANVILGALAFDSRGNLWVEQYIDQANPDPAGADHLIKFDSDILTANDGDEPSCMSYALDTRNTVLHRITEGPDGNIWFTELAVDKIGKLVE